MSLIEETMERERDRERERENTVIQCYTYIAYKYCTSIIIYP